MPILTKSLKYPFLGIYNKALIYNTLQELLTYNLLIYSSFYICKRGCDFLKKQPVKHENPYIYELLKKLVI